MTAASITPAAGAKSPSADIPFNKKPVSPAKIIGTVIGYVAMIAIAAFTLLPFIWMLLASVKPNNEVFMVPFKWLPSVWHFENYINIWTKSDMLLWVGNTVFFAIIVTFLQVFTGSFAAYGFSRIKFAGRNALFLVYIATMAVPWQSYMIPQFKMLSSWGLVDTRWSIVLLQAFGAFGVFMMKQFYDTIPEELAEAARLDGLSEFGIYSRIVLPLSGPSIAALGIITFTNTWNDYMGPLIYLRSQNLQTIQLGLKTFISQFNADYAMIMTGSVLSILPILVVFLIGQKQFIEGIATSGMKG
ncbi:MULTISPECIES: carbohydrate ABC transporter permease [Bifidobacterium]|uniref:ABC transporter, permease protein, probably The fructooligosaccharide porter n=2 Tax=Bifidobacterium TaxID=1678 RepID=A0A086ZKG3_9BIFI|nr:MULTISPECIES: carbohydrate ABC transporter permease [Bifidobacterium]KFI47013.1 ABC transporter, permease protein, probably The fructooligosaccharide porter [Bifidobacterium biavatii DSM 23969]MBW3093312.1 carbohydrate ABC transporter permease [Bifidobacterium miconis]